MAESYPRRNQARGLWKINDITKNIKNEGTYPQAYSNKGFFGGGGSPNGGPYSGGPAGTGGSGGVGDKLVKAANKL